MKEGDGRALHFAFGVEDVGDYNGYLFLRAPTVGALLLDRSSCPDAGDHA